MTLQRTREAGFSLAEVVVALGLLAGVLISVAGLLVLGNRQVDGGRRSTQALAIARDVMEEVGSGGFRHTYERFDCDETEAFCTVDTSQPVVGLWRQQVERALNYSRVFVKIDALDAPSLAGATTLRITVSVTWRTGLRSRRISVATVRT